METKQKYSYRISIIAVYLYILLYNSIKICVQYWYCQC